MTNKRSPRGSGEERLALRLDLPPARHAYSVRVLMNPQDPGPPAYCAARYIARPRKDGLMVWVRAEDIGPRREERAAAAADLTLMGLVPTPACTHGGAAVTPEDVLPAETAVEMRLGRSLCWLFGPGGRKGARHGEWHKIDVAVGEFVGRGKVVVVADVGKMTRRQWRTWSEWSAQWMPHVRVEQVNRVGMKVTRT